jgi:hypothetical protein
MSWSDVVRSSHLAGDGCAASRRPLAGAPRVACVAGPDVGCRFLLSPIAKLFCNLPIFFPARHLPTYTWRACSSQNTLINPFAYILLAPC